MSKERSVRKWQYHLEKSQRMRRTHYKIEANGTVKCSNCGADIRSHRVCPECGFYKGKNVVEKEEAAK